MYVSARQCCCLSCTEPFQTPACAHLQKQHELAEIDVLQQNPCTMWALPFIATRSSLPGSALGAPPSAHETAPQPVTDTSSQPQFADKASADSGFPASSESLPQPHRDIAPSGPLAELSSKDAKQTTAASHWVQVRAYQPDNLNAIADNALPSSVPKGLATTSNTTGQQQTAAAAWLESVLADNDTRATSATMLNGIPVHQAAEQSRAVSSSTAAKDAQIHSKVPLGTAGKIQQAKTASQHADRSAAPQAQMEASQSQKQVSQASRTRQEKANPDGRAAPQAQQLAAAGTAPDGVQINTDTAHGGSSAPGLEAAQRSNAAADQSSTPESATRKRDQQQIAGPTRSGSPADSSDLLAKATSEAADAQTNRASKQARARRAKPAAAADSTDSDEGTPREQQDQLSKAEGSGASRTKVAQLTGKRQQREAPDKPVVKKAKQTNSQAASQQKTENGKAAGTGVEKKRQSSKDTSVQKKQSEVKTDLPSQTLDNIFDSLKELGLLRNHHGNGELTRSDIQALDIRPPLLQLRILSWYASKFQTGGNPHRFLQISTTNMVKQSANTNWLAHRSLSSGTPRAHTLSPEAHALHKELLSLRMLPDNAVPEVALQSLPSELHPAYVLALAGYPGKRLQNFAQNLLHSILWQVCRAVQQQNSISHTFQVAMSSYADAVGKPFLPSEGHSGADKGAQPGSSKAAAKGTGNAAAQDTRQGLSSKRKHSPIPIPAPFSKDSKTAPVTKVPTFVNGLPVSSPAPKTGQQHSIDAAPSKPKKPKTRIHLHMSEVAATALDGLIRLRRLQPNSLDDHSLDFLHKQSPLWQMHILSFFSERVNSGNASAYLTSICKANKIAAYNRDFRWVQQTGQIEAHTLTLLNHACMAGLVSQEFVSTVTLQSIPKDLHGIAVCYALGSVSTAPTHQAQQQNGTPHVLQLGTRQAQSAFHTIIQYIHQLLEEEVPNYRPLGPSDPSRPHTAPPSGASSHPPLQAQDSFPSYDRPTSLQHSSSHQHAHNGVQDYNRPCPFYFRSSGGCGNQGCPYIHGTHEKYVAYMKRTGLIPYSLKFQSGLDRDRCVGDDAVDVLNDMMLDKTIPRGSFGDWDLQPLAFLEDPHSANASQLQLQVSMHHNSMV